MRLVVGIDPGVTCSGVCLCAEEKSKFDMLCAATFNSRAKGFGKLATYLRVHDLAEEIGVWVNHAVSIVDEDSYTELVCSIERPIYNKNARSFEIQWRLFQSLYYVMFGTVLVSKVSEVHNGTAKLVLTGDGRASKERMLAHAPVSVKMFPDYDDREAVADAYAICISVDQGKPINDNEWEDLACTEGPVAEWRK